MRHIFVKIFVAVVLVGGVIGLNLLVLPTKLVLAQKPTVNIATVTSTPSGPVIIVKNDPAQPQINVRAGPGTAYAKVGVLLAGQKAPAKGRSAGGNWILIEYPGIPGGEAWVFSPYVDLSPGPLPVVEPPSTPTPLVTSTIDPTLAAQFVITPLETTLPTFTAPPPLVIPTFEDASSQAARPGSVPMGMVIIGLASVGIILGLIGFTQGR